MIPRDGQVLDYNKVPVQGASIYVYNQDGTAATLTSDGVTALDQPLTTDEFGNYSYQADEGYYYEDTWYGGKLRFRENNIALGNPGADLNLRSDLAASGGSALVEYSGRTVEEKLGDLLSVKDRGAVGDGTTDDTAAITAAGNASGKKFVPSGTYKTTLASTALSGPFWGTGSIKDASGNLRGRWFSAISSAPTSMGDGTSVETWANGDMSRVQLSMEHRITGAATLGQPTTGYLYTPEAYAQSGFLYNSSGWNNGTGDNSGRTAACFHRVRIYNAGQGDAVAFNFSGFVTGARSGATHFLANPAACGFNGNIVAGSDGVYLNPYETLLDDAGHDVAGVGFVTNLNRTNATGALSAYWAAFRAQSIGSAAVDALISGAGKFNVGTDYTGCNFGTNQAAIALVRGQRVYGNASTTDPDLLRATSLGADYFVNSASGWDFYIGGALAGRIGASGIGYAVGAGGAVTQATSKSTAVTLNKVTGQITMNGAALAASTSVSFTLTNSTIAATDTVSLNIASGATAGSYIAAVDAVTAGSCRIHLRNVSAGSLSEALILNFNVIKGAAS